MSDKTDRRSLRTRHLVGRAWLELIREKGYDAITVNDIIARANVGRSTFYAHYRDKDDLFVKEVDRVIDALHSDALRDPRDEGWYFPSLGLFRHVGDEYELYRALLWSSGMDLFVREMQKSLARRIERGLQESGNTYEIPIPALATFVASSFLALLKWWLENKMVHSPEEMDDMFKKLVRSGFQ